MIPPILCDWTCGTIACVIGYVLRLFLLYDFRSLTTIVQKEVATDAPFCLQPFDSVWLRLPLRTTLSKKSGLVITILRVLDGTASCQYDKDFVEKENAPGEQGASINIVRSIFYGCSILEWYSLLSAIRQRSRTWPWVHPLLSDSLPITDFNC